MLGIGKKNGGTERTRALTIKGPRNGEIHPNQVFTMVIVKKVEQCLINISSCI